MWGVSLDTGENAPCPSQTLCVGSVGARNSTGIPPVKCRAGPRLRRALRTVYVPLAGQGFFPRERAQGGFARDFSRFCRSRTFAQPIVEGCPNPESDRTCADWVRSGLSMPVEETRHAAPFRPPLSKKRYWIWVETGQNRQNRQKQCFPTAASDH